MGLDSDTTSALLSTSLMAGGAAFGGPVGAMIGGGIGSVVGGMMGGNAAAKAARAQQEAAERYRQYISSQESKAVGMVMTPAAMAAHDQALQSQETNVKRMESLASAMSPSLVEAGKQTAALLQGKAAPVLQNIQAQRAQQRQQMLDNLRTQMGPGAETSSAGMKAMQQFDLQTSDLMNSAQQSYLDKVSNMSLSGTATLGDTLNRASATLDQVNADGPQNTAAKLIASFTGAGAGAAQAGIEAAGGEFRKQQLMGQSLQQMGNAAIVAGAGQLGKNSVGQLGGSDQAANAGLTKAGIDPNQLNASMQLQQPAMGGNFGAGQGFSLAGGGSAGPTAPRLGTLGAAMSSPAGVQGTSPYVTGKFAQGGYGAQEPITGMYLPNYKSDSISSGSMNVYAGGQ